MARGIVFDIQRFAIHDGPGIRTAVYLKGCPLRCLWCHNPEGQAISPEIFFLPEKCIACRSCEQACKHGNHRSVNGFHIYDREDCDRCGSCTQECYAGALELVGQRMSVEEVLAEVMKDRDFYQTSGGGMTVSGGEPMQQIKFTSKLLHASRQAGLHNCLETSGYGPFSHYDALLPDVDLFLYDIKETDPGLHRKYTGATNQGILANLLALDQAGAATILRCPIIPGLNDRDDHFRGIARLANQIQHLQEIHVLPYHPLGISKSQRLGKITPLEGIPTPANDQIRAWVSAIQNLTMISVHHE